MSDRIEVVGTGTAEVRPDRRIARLGAEAVGPDVATAVDVAGTAVRAMTAAARASGLMDPDLRTEGMNIGQHHDHQGRPTGYRAWFGLTVTLRDIDNAGAVLGDVLAAGGDAARLVDTSFGVADPSAAVSAARESAVSDARSQAAHLAALAGRSLGAVRRLSTVPAAGEPLPFVLTAASSRSGGALPVEAGETTVTVTVHARFDLA